MSAQLASAVRDRLDSPRTDETVTLIVGVSVDTSVAIEQIESVGGNVEEELPYHSLAVAVDEPNLDDLCCLDIVETVEIEKEYESRGGSDFRSH